MPPYRHFLRSSFIPTTIVWLSPLSSSSSDRKSRFKPHQPDAQNGLDHNDRGGAHVLYPLLPYSKRHVRLVRLERELEGGHRDGDTAGDGMISCRSEVYDLSVMGRGNGVGSRGGGGGFDALSYMWALDSGVTKEVGGDGEEEDGTSGDGGGGDVVDDVSHGSEGVESEAHRDHDSSDDASPNHISSPSNKREILVNGIPLSIPANLHAFLDALRKEDELPLLWCDSICVNQSDAEERARQVSMMGFIYSSATQVRAWICDPRLSGRPYDVQYRRSRYWSRMWILQELLLAKRIMWYADENGAVREEDLRSENEEFSQIMGRLPRTLEILRERRTTGEVKAPLVELLRDFGTLECSDVRDKVHALRALASESERRELRVDYEAEEADVLFETLLFVDTKPSEVLAHARVVAEILGAGVSDLRKVSIVDGKDITRSDEEDCFTVRLEPVRPAVFEGEMCRMVSHKARTLVIRSAEKRGSGGKNGEGLEVEFLDSARTREVAELPSTEDWAVDLKLSREGLTAFLFPEEVWKVSLDRSSVEMVSLQAIELGREISDDMNAQSAVKVTDDAGLRKMGSALKVVRNSKL